MIPASMSTTAPGPDAGVASCGLDRRCPPLLDAAAPGGAGWSDEVLTTARQRRAVPQELKAVG
ncbi:hypothetical protein [Arthrobacter nitrophenolicus]|uniref:Uncharacterized protein n=1 Tax=Arthrobacter nitrophenolicus TaxID=683150 RepID=A0A4R5XZ54_9MICC|nr:hypothetical protein [Arthrobacter nitrophenolicus]TDL37250.1 hypothetical protein E2R57_10890 [Arthrobacter nitrophenolicus]